MISAVNCRPLSSPLLFCFTVSPTRHPHVVAQAGQVSKLQQIHGTCPFATDPRSGQLARLFRLRRNDDLAPIVTNHICPQLEAPMVQKPVGNAYSQASGELS